MPGFEGMNMLEQLVACVTALRKEDQTLTYAEYSAECVAASVNRPGAVNSAGTSAAYALGTEREKKLRMDYDIGLISLAYTHPGVVVAKVGYFDPKSAKVPSWADGHQTC